MEAIREGESLWRDVYRERQKRALDCPVEDRKVSKRTKSVFGSAQDPDPRVSTNRYDGVSLEFATEEGDRRAAQIDGSNGVQGWLIITMRDASRGRRRVEYSPQEDNPYHTEIVLPEEHARDWEDAEVHLMEFLSLSTWQGRAGPLPGETNDTRPVAERD